MRNNMNKSKDNNLNEFKNYSKSEVKLIKFFIMIPNKKATKLLKVEDFNKIMAVYFR